MPETASAHYTLKPSPYSSHSLLLDLLPPTTPRRILDVGCGNGYLAEILASRGHQVTGIERPDGVTREFPASVRLIPADLERGLPPLGTFDTILCADILEHLRDPAALLSQLRRHLAPGGSFICSLPNSGNIHFRLTVLAGRFPKEEKGLFDGTHVQFFTWDGWTRLFASAGLRFESVHPTAIPVGLRFPRWDGTVPVSTAEALCYYLARLRKQLFAYQFVVEAR
ncbi:MAG: class I SAM-dependent methyltransferase [Acidobacteria bacterium]|nr:class I SAM-dependent methyltransferase [Acidobacteriota bacterium]